MQLRKKLSIIGPGLLWAGAAIGVSHLVQSTRAGAGFGFDLVWILIIANIMKYPFFEFGPRYVSATGTSLIEGYRKIGKWAIVLYFLITVATMFTIQAAVTIVTAGLFISVFDITLSPVALSAIILTAIILIILVGKYALIDKVVKFIIIMLAISTVIAVIAATSKGYNPNPDVVASFSFGKSAHLLFFFAFVGWMPAPLDVSIWHSYWSVEKSKQLGYQPKLKSVLLDFNIGFIGTAFLAVGFLTLGAILMYSSGSELSPKSGVFAGQLISLFTGAIGEWSYWIIAVAALSTMVSTTITCLDAYPRVLEPTSLIVFNNKNRNNRLLFISWLLVVAVGSILVLGYFASSMRVMVDIATVVSVVTAPLFALMNYLAINNKEIVPDSHRPKTAMRIYAIIAMISLFGLSLWYLTWRFIV